MARKESITRDMILEMAFELARDNGIESVTARNVAARIGCSTQPIFRIYANMEQLREEIFQRAIDTF